MSRLTRRSASLRKRGQGLFALSTPILVEGDSNTAWPYNLLNWMKRALTKAGGRFYIPVGGFFANAGAKIDGGSTNSMLARKDAMVAKITAEVATFGKCLVWFQIGTNGGDAVADIPTLTSIVNAYKAAGATVWCNLCPLFNAGTGYIQAINAAIVAGTIPVHGYINVQPVVIPADGKTHYSEPEHDAVGALVAAQMLTMIDADPIYDDAFPGFTVDAMTGTGGTPGTGGSGQLPTGFSGSRQSGNATVVYSIVGPDADGLYAIDMVVTAGTTRSQFTLSKTEALALALGDVVEGGATVQVLSATDDASILHAHVAIAGGYFPASSVAALTPAYWDDPLVWRTYPINQASAGASFTKQFRCYVEAGKSAAFRIKGFFHAVREHASAVAPQITAAPVMSPVVVGQPLACANGSYSGTTPITLTQQFYIGEDSVPSSYIPASGDAGDPVTCYETATNSAGSVTQISNTVTVQPAASVTLGALTLSPNTGMVGSAYTGTVGGKTSGSTLSLTGPGAAGLSVTGSTISGTPTATGAVNIVETLAGATNTPATSSSVLTIAATDTWWADANSVDLDFVNDRYFKGSSVSGFSAYLTASGSAFARASAKSMRASSGALAIIASGVLARDSQGALIEAGTTNLDSRSENATFDSTTGTTAGVNDSTAPDGATTADTLTETTATSTHSAAKTYGVTAGQPYVYSRFVKAGTVDKVQLVPTAGGLSAAFVNFDLAAGVVGTSGGTGISASGIELYADGWYRIWIAFTPTGTTATIYTAFNNNSASGARLSNYAGSTGSNLRVFGHQLEQQAALTSYIPSTGGTATARAADALVISLPAGTHTLTATFSDDSTQTLAGLSGNYALPTNLNKRRIKRISGVRTAP